MKKSAGSFKKKNFERLENRSINVNGNSALEEENADILTRRIELYKQQIERKLENVSFKYLFIYLLINLILKAEPK